MPPSARYGGTAVVGNIGEIPDGMNNHVSQGYTASQHQNFVNLMTLVQYDEDLNPTPYLAESWEVSDDVTEITFHIRDDVYWHDGELTDAYDVAYTFKRAIDPETAFPNTSFWTYYDQGPDGVEVVDSFTVKFLMRPHADFIDPLAGHGDHAGAPAQGCALRHVEPAPLRHGLPSRQWTLCIRGAPPGRELDVSSEPGFSRWPRWPPVPRSLRLPKHRRADYAPHRVVDRAVGRLHPAHARSGPSHC